MFDMESLEQLWSTIGYDETERVLEQVKLDSFLKSAFQSFLNTTSQYCATLEKQIETVVINHIKLMRAFSEDEQQIQIVLQNSQNGTLKERLSNVTTSFQEYQAKCQPCIKKFNELHKKIQELFDILGVSENARGDFAFVGETNFSAERLHKFEQKVELLDVIIESHKKRLEILGNSIQDTCDLLDISYPEEVSSIIDSCSISEPSLKIIEKIDYELMKLKESRQKELEIKTEKLKKLWQLLDTPQIEQEMFIDSFSSIGDSVVKAYDEEINRLIELRNQNLETIVEKQKTQIQNISADLHIKPSQVISFDNTEGFNLLQLFNHYDVELDKLKNLFSHMRPYLDLISQREELLKESDTIAESTKEIAKLQSQKKEIDPKVIAKTEQARRRVKSLLPRLEKKLLIMLIEYQSTHGEDLIWDGSPYIQSLSHIMLSDVELKKARGSRKSFANSKRMSCFSCIFDNTMAKSFSRKSLENNKSFGNWV